MYVLLADNHMYAVVNSEKPRKLRTPVSIRAMSTDIIQSHYEENYLKSTRVVQAAGDNICLYHSLSFNLNREELYSNVYDANKGFTWQHLVNDCVRELRFERFSWTDYCKVVLHFGSGQSFGYWRWSPATL